MTRATQAVVLTLLGTCLIGLTASQKYLNYVRPWTRAPLLVCGLLLVGSSVRQVLRRPREGGHQDVPKVAWLLLLPVLVVLVAKPPELGAYVAERQGNHPPPRTKLDLPSATSTRPVDLGIFEFAQVAAYNADFLRTIRVRLTGFVSYDAQGNWYITRLSITCCAADALSSRVRVIGAVAPPRNSWLTVVGTWVDPHAANPEAAKPELQALSMTRIKTPRDPYEH